MSKPDAHDLPNGLPAGFGGDVPFRLLVDGVKDFAICMLDPEGRVASWNLGAACIFGYAPAEITGQHFSCFYPLEEQSANKPDRVLERAVAHGRIEEEGPRVRKDGSTFWASVITTPLRDSHGILRGFAKVTRDISGEKRSEEKTTLMVQLAVNAMVLVDAQGQIVMVNPQTEKLFGYASSELLGQPVEILIPDSSKAIHPARRNQFFANPSVRAMGAGRELFARRKDGSAFPVEIGLNPIGSGPDLLVLGSIIDITERKRTEEESRRHLAEVAHAGRLSTVGEMFSGLAHELNQPLAAAANYARACIRMAQSEAGLPPEQLEEWLEKTAVQAERASAIVRRLSAFVKKERSDRSVLNINRLIENVVTLPTFLSSRSDSTYRLSFQLDFAEPIAEIVADKVQIEQVILNLVRNAVEATETNTGSPPQLTISTRQEDKLIHVQVSDNGHGIDADQIPKLFSPFFTTKTEGMGLGLSISRSIIETHGGQMSVESESGKGTTVSFRLPTHHQEVVP